MMEKAKAVNGENFKQCTPYSENFGWNMAQDEKMDCNGQIKLNVKTEQLPLKASPKSKLEKSGYYVNHGNYHKD